MKRITILLIATVVVFLGITILATRNFAVVDKTDKHAGHHQAQASGAKKTPQVDGSIDPSKIPDIDAQEILFKILSANNPNDKYEAQRKKSFLRTAGFSDAEAAAITNAAYEYKRQIEPLDAEVHSIKNRYWPHPP